MPPVPYSYYYMFEAARYNGKQYNPRLEPQIRFEGGGRESMSHMCRASADATTVRLFSTSTSSDRVRTRTTV